MPDSVPSPCQVEASSHIPAGRRLGEEACWWNGPVWLIQSLKGSTYKLREIYIDSLEAYELVRISVLIG